MNQLKTGQTIASNRGSRSHVHTLVLMAVTVGGLYIFYLLTAPFIFVLEYWHWQVCCRHSIGG